MKPIYWLLVLLLLSQAQVVQSTESHANIPTCDKLLPALQTWIDKGVFQGNLLLAKNSKILCHSNIGFADQDKQEWVLTDSGFPIASLSKPVVATLLLKLQENRNLDLHTTLDQYLPEFPAPWANQVTLHHLLSNRSGLPVHFALPNWRKMRYQPSLADGELLNEIASLELRFEPGTEYLYTNLGWTLLEEVVEKITGKGFAENLQENVFNPLAMMRTGLVSKAPISLVKGYRWGKNGGWQRQQDLNRQVLNGGAGLYSTTEDLLKFLTAVHHGDWLTAKSKELMFSVVTPYGWRTENLILTSDVNKQVRSYDGQIKGHSSFVYHVPEDNVSLVMLNNTGMGFEHKKALADDMLRAVYKLPLSDSHNSLSLKLNRSLLDNQWQISMRRLISLPVNGLQNALLLGDLAQQLEWSGNTTKAIALYAWLASRSPENSGLKQKVEMLCAEYPTLNACEAYTRVNSDKKLHVGMSLLPLKDPSRNAWRSKLPRPVTTHLFYPSHDENVEALMLGPKQAPLFAAGTVVKAGEAVQGKRPLILMSHGTGGSAPQLLWLAQALVKQGYIVAAVNHHGNTAIEPQKYPEGFLLWWERAQDLQLVRLQLLKDTSWSERIDANKLAVVGFSLGGYTALSALGGITDRALFNDYCQQAVDDFSCLPQPEFSTVLEEFEKVKGSPQVINSNARQHHNYRIPGLKAAVVLAPALVHAFTPDSLANIKIPTLLIVGSEDKIAPARPNAVYANSFLLNSQLVTIDNAHHYSFLSLCTDHGKRILAQLCDHPYGITRQQVHQQAVEKTVAFLREIFNRQTD